MDPNTIASPSALGADRVMWHHADIDDLIAPISALLAERGFAPPDTPLADLHRHLTPDAGALDEHYMNDVSRSFYQLSDAVRAAYLRLIGALARDVSAFNGPAFNPPAYNGQAFDFLFQAAPVVRFLPPTPFPPNLRTAAGRGSQLHSDILGGHPPAMINCWLALTPARNSNALHLSSRAAGIEILTKFADARVAGVAEEAGFDALAGTLADFFALQHDDADFAERVADHCPPHAMTPGDLVLFDPRCIHGGVENREAATRVSLDFRILPLPDPPGDFERAIATRHPRWTRGDILHDQSARELTCSA